MAGTAQHAIFIGYRREDSQDTAGRIYDRLVAAFGEPEVFKDVDNLPIGTDFGDYILGLLPQCRVFLALIGPGWLDARDASGARRIDNPADWVRIEIETALKTPGLQVVPVLVNGARMPREDELPQSLRALARLNAAVVRRDPDFHADMTRIVSALKEALRHPQLQNFAKSNAKVAKPASPNSAPWWRRITIGIAVVASVAGFAFFLDRVDVLPRPESKGVNDYLRDNPQVVEDAIKELERRREADRRERIESDPRDVFIGARNAPITIVEFFDYRCPYCQAARTWLQDAVAQNPGRVRVIFKEFPILSNESLEASQAAMAAAKQDKYLEFHNAVMTSKGTLNSAHIDAIAERVGIDVLRMRRDMRDPKIMEHLTDNREIANEAGIEGTPAILVDGQWVRGWDRSQAEQHLVAALRRTQNMRPR